MKRVGGLALALLSITAASIATTPSASANPGDPIVYEAKPGSVLKKDYPVPMAANDAAGVFTYPGDCELAPSCTEIPLKIVLPPDFDPETGDFVVNVTLTWNLAGSPDENAVNDLDMYIYEMERENPETGEKEPGIAAQSATGAMPEVAKMFTPSDKADYRILVSNYVGPNSGFSLELTYKDFSFEPPEEPEEPTGSRTGAAGGSDDAPAADDPAPADGGEETPDDEPVGGENGEVAAPPVGADSAEDVLTPASDSDFEFGLPTGRVPTPNEAASLFRNTREVGTPGKVGGGVLAAWLGVAPIALLAAVIGFILKRRPPALSMAFPTGPVRADAAADA